MIKGMRILGILIVLLLFLLLIALIASLSIGEILGYFIILPIGILVVIGYLLSKKEENMKKKLDSVDVTQREKEEIREYFRKQQLKEMESKLNKERKKKAISNLTICKYMGGHERYSKPTKTDIYLYNDEIEVYKEYSHELLFSVPIKNIKRIEYDSSEHLSLSKFILFGLPSLAMKEKTYYLIVEYISNKGIENQIIFEVGSYKSQEFANKLNVLRNNSVSSNLDRQLGNNNVLESIKQLAELKEKGILTEQEFERKKSELLMKI